MKMFLVALLALGCFLQRAFASLPAHVHDEWQKRATDVGVLDIKQVDRAPEIKTADFRIFYKVLARVHKVERSTTSGLGRFKPPNDTVEFETYTYHPPLRERALFAPGLPIKLVESMCVRVYLRSSPYGNGTLSLAAGEASIVELDDSDCALENPVLDKTPEDTSTTKNGGFSTSATEASGSVGLLLANQQTNLIFAAAPLVLVLLLVEVLL